MRVIRLSVLSCLLLTQSVLASPIDIITTPIDLGIVNGEVINQKIKIEKSLNNPILISVKQQDYKKPLQQLTIKNAVLTYQSSNELVLTVSSPLSHVISMQSQVALGLWINGQRINITGEQVGNDVKIDLLPNYKTLELRVIKPVEMVLPKDYRGEFKYSIDIEASLKN